MLTKFFRPKWQHADPKVRRAFVERMPKDDQALISTILSSDDSPDVRLCAFSKLSSLQQKIDWVKTPPAESDKPAFMKAFVAQIDDQHTAQSLKPETLMQLKQNDLLDTFVKHSGSPSLVDQIITDTSDETLCLNYLQQSKNHAIRHKLALRIHSEEALKTAYQRVKSTDKTTAKLLKKKLDVIQSNRKCQEAEVQKAENLLNKLVVIKKGTSTTPLEAEWSAARQSFNALRTSELPPELVASIDASLSEFQNILDQTEQDKQTKLRAETEKALKANNLKGFNEAVEHVLSQINDEKTPTSDIETAVGKLNEALVANKAIADHERQQLQANISSLHTQHQHLIALKRLLHAANEKNVSAKEAIKEQTDINRLASKLSPSSPWVKKAHETVITLNEKIDREKKQSQENLNALKKQTTSTETAIENKQLKEAKKYLSQTRQSFRRLPSHEQKKWSLTLKRLEGGVNALSDWRQFSTDPIRQTLLTKMEGLVETSMDAQSKIQSIKTLQKEWQALGYTEDQEQWEAFQALANKAYAPCKEVFEKEKTLRIFNAKQREQICAETEQFVEGCDWARADYKALDKLLKTIHTEWKRFSPVERSEHQALQARFSSTTTILKDKLQAHKSENLTKLETLNTKAESLLTLENSKQAINDYKTLMNEWKTVGITFREKQIIQWEAFRTNGDQIYAKQKATRLLDQEAEQSLVNQYNTYLDNIKQLTLRLNDASTDARPITVEYNKIRKHFHDIGTASVKAQLSLRSSLDRHCLQFDKALKQHQDAQWKHQLSYFGHYAATLTNHPDEAEAFENLPPEWRIAITRQRERYQSAVDSHARDVAINCCIDLEILCDKPSPESDNDVRINRQMQLLKKSFGLESTDEDKEASIVALYLKWFGQPITFLNDHPELTSRFLSCMSK